MARGPSSRVVLNRSALDQTILAIGDGLFAVGKEIIDTAKPPDASPFGEGLPKQGGVLAYAGGKKIAGYGLDGKQPRVPRAAHISRQRGVVVIVGWGFPARFNELGSIHNTPNPFFTRAVDEVLPRAQSIMRQHVKLPKADRA